MSTVIVIRNYILLMWPNLWLNLYGLSENLKLKADYFQHE